MPNWCSNRLDIVGDQDRIEEFFEYAKGEETALDFGKFIPYPKILKILDEGLLKTFKEIEDNLYFQELDKTAQNMILDKIKTQNIDADGFMGGAGFNVGGYEWNCTMWGTKWNASDAERYDNTIIFSTAWSPPGNTLMTKISETFPDLIFELEYEEPGVDFFGVFKIQNGEVIEDWSREIQLADQHRNITIEDWLSETDKYYIHYWVNREIERVTTSSDDEKNSELFYDIIDKYNIDIEDLRDHVESEYGYEPEWLHLITK